VEEEALVHLVTEVELVILDQVIQELMEVILQ
jgi:hypothetical protein